MTTAAGVHALNLLNEVVAAWRCARGLSSTAAPAGIPGHTGGRHCRFGRSTATPTPSPADATWRPDTARGSRLSKAVSPIWIAWSRRRRSMAWPWTWAYHRRSWIRPRAAFPSASTAHSTCVWSAKAQPPPTSSMARAKRAWPISFSTARSAKAPHRPRDRHGTDDGRPVPASPPLSVWVVPPRRRIKSTATCTFQALRSANGELEQLTAVRRRRALAGPWRPLGRGFVPFVRRSAGEELPAPAPVKRHGYRAMCRKRRRAAPPTSCDLTRRPLRPPTPKPPPTCAPVRPVCDWPNAPTRRPGRCWRRPDDVPCCYGLAWFSAPR